MTVLPSQSVHGEPLDAEKLAERAGTDKAALADLYDRYADVVFRCAYAKLGDRNTAEDVAGQVWLRVAQTIGSYESRGEGSFARWLLTITRRIVVDQHRRRGRRREQLTGDMLALDLASHEESPGDVLERREAAEVVTRALGRLTRAQRECVTLRFWQGLTVPETAAVMGRSQGSVRALQHRALRLLAGAIPFRPAASTCTVTRSAGALAGQQT